jgi:succinate dehydrogenase/fumarate reductase-like Fe-S protein
VDTTRSGEHEQAGNSERGDTVSEKKIEVQVFRFDPAADEEPRYQSYAVPALEGRNLLNILDYIYEHLDGTLAYRDHAACGQAICGKCTLVVNDEPVLMCQAQPTEDIVVEPLHKSRVVRDLVCK